MTSTEINTASSIANPPLKFGSRDKSVGWYQPTLDSLTEAQRDLLEHYSHISPEKVIPHIYEFRDRAWEIHPYPCIGHFRFIDLCLSRSSSYPLVLSRLQNGASLLDLGCCIAQDMRKLVHDGAPSTNLYGAELKPEFISLGYELFLDKDTFGAHFMQADLFEDGGALEKLKGKMDIVQAGLFLHLFDLEGQMEACERIVALLKQEKGVLILGQQIGATESHQMPKESGSKMYKHNADSFEKMWQEVGRRTGTEWKVTAWLDGWLGVDMKKRLWDDPSTRRLVFELERIA